MHEIGTCLKILADETRIRILHVLSNEPLTVAELQDILQLRQSSVSSHLAKLKHAQLIYARTEGSSHRYRICEDMPENFAASWEFVRSASEDDPAVRSDRVQLERVRQQLQHGWVEHVAGSLHRSYAPGRNWDSFGHGFLHFADFGVCIDIGAGDGALIDVLAPRSGQLICVDPSAAMLTAAQTHIDKRGYSHVSCLEASGELLPLPDEHADSVLFLQSLQYVEAPEAALQEAIRLLKPGGRILILTLLEHTYSEAARYGHIHQGFSEKDIRNWCAALTAHSCDILPPEDQAPRFETLVYSGVKANL